MEARQYSTATVQFCPTNLPFLFFEKPAILIFPIHLLTAAATSDSTCRWIQAKNRTVQSALTETSVIPA